MNLYDKLVETLKTVVDPEMAPVDIVELGLVYEITIHEGNVKILMTLTAPACPVAGEIIEQIQDKISKLEGVNDVHVQLTFDPPWTKEMMSDEARFELGFM
jgi:FeS assembly SUF system protein